MAQPHLAGEPWRPGSRSLGQTRFLGALVWLLAALGGLVPSGHSVTLAWSPSPASNVVGYNLYYGPVSGDYSNLVNVGNVTNTTISELDWGATYYFAVTALDTLGDESDFSNEISYTVPVSNTPPTLVLTAPLNDASYGIHSAVHFAASVIANNHAISQVRFYNGTTLLGEDSAAPYSLVWSNLSAGSYSLSAQVVYEGGSTLASAVATVAVTNPPPTLALTAPLNGASYTAPATVALAASVTANGHTVTKVQFYNGATLLGENPTAPYSLVWSNVSAGSYSLSARVVYDAGSIVPSTPLALTVAGLPAPWQTVDIGHVEAVGNASVSNGVWTVTGAGNLSGTADNFRFVYQPMSGDGEIKIHLNSVQNTGTGKRGGVIIRESLTSDSAYAFLGISSDGSVRWQFRGSTGAGTSSSTWVPGTPPDAWVRLVRTGKMFFGESSIHGTNATHGASGSSTMATNIYVGLAVASGSSNVLNTSTFSSVTVVP